MEVLFNNESDFKKDLILEEVNNLNERKPITGDKFDFEINFIVENDENYEIEFYFRNNLDFDLRIGKIPLNLEYDGCVIAKQVVNFVEEFGVIPKKSVKSCALIVDKKNIYNERYINEAKLMLPRGIKINVDGVIKTDIINLPKEISYEQERYFKEQIDKLSSLYVDSYRIDCIGISKDENKNIDIILLVRNGYSHDIAVQGLPIQIMNELNLPIYIGNFTGQNILIEKRSSRLYLFKINRADLIKEYDDYSNFTVKIG